MCHQAIACADDAQRLLVTGQYAAAAVQLQQAIGLGLLSAHAHEAWLLIYGREDVAMNQERAFQLAEEGVILGCYHCQGVLAFCYWGGYGCDANETRSLELAIESSNKGSKYGQLSLGFLRQDNKLCELAASQGLDEAQHSIGTTLFNNGLGFVEHYPEALQWFQRAAAQGHIRAIFFVAYFFHHGHGVPSDVAIAIQWYRRAAAAGLARAECALNELLPV
jgi:TPR repeat protein